MHAVHVWMLLLSRESDDIITGLIYVVLFATAADTHHLMFLLLQYVSLGWSRGGGGATHIARMCHP